MSATATAELVSRRRWELVRCSNLACGHERIREATGRLTLPCAVCRCEMLTLPLKVDYEEEDVASDLLDARSALAHVLEQEREAEEATSTISLNGLEHRLHLGRRQAFEQTLDMLDTLIKRVNRKSGGHQEPPTAASSTVSDPLRTEPPQQQGQEELLA